MQRCQICYALIVLLLFPPALLVAYSIESVLKRYSDGLEATNAKRNNLAIAFLVPVAMAMIWWVVMKVFCTRNCETSRDRECHIMTALVTTIIVLTISLPVGLAYKNKFESIPASCSTENECMSHCSERNETYKGNLTNIQQVDAVRSNFTCGTCTCICSQTEDCNPVEYDDSGFSTATKIAIAVSSSVAVIVIVISITVSVCCFDDYCIAYGFAIGFFTVLLFTCTLAILVANPEDTKESTRKRNVSLMATLIPLSIIVIGLLLTFCRIFGVRDNNNSTSQPTRGNDSTSQQSEQTEYNDIIHHKGKNVTNIFISVDSTSQAIGHNGSSSQPTGFNDIEVEHM